jgi:hypothetical protein
MQQHCSESPVGAARTPAPKEGAQPLKKAAAASLPNAPNPADGDPCCAAAWGAAVLSLCTTYCSPTISQVH